MTAEPLIPYLDASKIKVWPSDLEWPRRSPSGEPVQNFELGCREQLDQWQHVAVRRAGGRLLSAYQLVLERLPVGHSRGDLDRAEGSEESFVGHFNLLTVCGLVTRHVVGALLTALRQLHPRAWARRAAETRPSGTTTEGRAR